MRDVISNLQLIRGAKQTLSGVTANNSALIDRRGFSSVTVYLETGTITDAGTAAGFTMKLQHSDSTLGTSFVDATDAELVPGSSTLRTVTVTLDTDDDILAGGVGYIGGKRYVRAVITGTTLTAADVFILATLGHPARAPTTTVGATTAST